ncbi:endo alpha-1,4 polygalactosaminidase [Streptomyces sp. CHD11]|uniref:endo alpha-1,4 polygalactosaminidase n=1 Tax=Streptomyces sp. CHD11 TaxID=2741325 RepID=UPI001BFC597E|nr:endo alpha-1,4 polygalactosaminidase [Streptomyces sp. CHD11]MBT3150396.1 endo alpha-1,4 polygalactosaminidase [Streptomyces sp. CHD11]
MSLLATARSRITLAAVLVAAGATAVLVPGAEAAEPEPPPVHADFDYQIGKPYDPPTGVTVVSRDWKQSPAPGLYNICYVNAFQTQEVGDVDGPDDWDPALLLLNDAGKPVYDPDWDEAILDITTDAKRQAIADRISTQIDTCADKGFDALELDNFDTYGRDVVEGRITADDAQAYIRILSSYGHGKGLAVGQKNTVELAPNREENGLDFAVAEECGQYDECGEYAEAFNDNVIVIEYTDEGMKTACDEFGDRLSVVQRDTPVLAPGETEEEEDDEGNVRIIEYVRKTC